MVDLYKLTYEDLKNLSHTEVNELARRAKGDIVRLRSEGKPITEENFTPSLWYIGEVFREEIARLVDKHLPHFNRTSDDEHGETAYERRLKKKLYEAVERYDGIRNFVYLARFAFRQATGEFYKRRSSLSKNEFSYEYLTSETDMKTEKKVTVFIPDLRENVERAVIGKEMRQALYKRFGHCARRRFIIERLDELDNPKNIDVAREMCRVFVGTKESSNKRFITRFKYEMQQFIISTFGDRRIA